MPHLKLTSGPLELRTLDPIERWLNRYRLRIEQAYRVACSSDVPEPDVFACDLLDDIGRRVARDCRGDREVEAILRDARAGRGPAIAFFAEPLERVVKRFAGVTVHEMIGPRERMVNGERRCTIRAIRIDACGRVR
jgi:hypothetical protein